MPEILLHYIWQRGIFKAFPQYTTDGRRIEVLSVGEHNTDAGADFSNVHLRFYGDDRSEEWVGNVEIHVASSDWYKHKHHTDPAYDRIVLHVVRKADKEVCNSRGERIPQCELRYPDEQDYLTQLLSEARLMDSPLATHRCGRFLLQDPSLITNGWKQTMLQRRLDCKKQSIDRLLAITHNHWEHAFYISLARYFGFHVNGVPFEQLAISTPLSCLQKHRNSLRQLTAILMGQSGLLPQDDELYREYAFLKTKFGLQPVDAAMWKRGRIRPQNAPETRIRQFAQLLFQSEFLFSKLMDTDDVDALRQLLTVDGLGRDSVDVLLINAVVPFKYARGRRQNALEILRALPAENNTVIRQWRELGQKITDAADTQALIHLYQTCCQQGQCINCDVAYQIFLKFRPQHGYHIQR